MLNKVILMGRLTKDPELRYTPSNVPVCTVTIAVDRNYAKQGEQRQADFIQIVAWRNNAEFICKYFAKGRMIAVSGSLQTRSSDDQEGKRHFITEVVVDEQYFADSKKDGNSQSQPNENVDPMEGFTPIDSDDDLPF
ncbi:single-stranded DNA-binding protein [Petroclostridium sp. X23]|uniref:single-stranded DNA-binding protein n=1 Tax=Petroclostridium sp. X23 TaxID=3045146 RepID=UPI0024AD1FBD|nr:single-stranded DNA-binding protein [Petroclostridium sp. X23]WHH59132.1 single-stranded DNA-binding protein [Petroclostridium sp. X23]